ncbi:MKRN2 opposite strand protein-like [Liolophura sinensis]|uniref:MKRN2 opposite strand protein-like n=1 Tax=Liolophura sinensis TaxID=3198878 RepID=UPI003158F9A5
MTSTVLCFQHCDRSTNILCFQVPAKCPLCGASTETTESRIPPFVIESPLTNAMSHPFSIIVKPTCQQFLQGYKDGDNLHIGVTTSNGHVYEYDEDGVCSSSEEWKSCLAVSVLYSQSYGSWRSQWDDQLLEFANRPDWSSERYDESTHNCFDFVLGFLRTLPLGLSPLNVSSKAELCQELVKSHTVKLGKYITIYKKIEDYGYVCMPANSD